MALVEFYCTQMKKMETRTTFFLVLVLFALLWLLVLRRRRAASSPAPPAPPVPDCFPVFPARPVAPARPSNVVSVAWNVDPIVNTTAINGAMATAGDVTIELTPGTPYDLID